MLRRAGRWALLAAAVSAAVAGCGTSATNTAAPRPGADGPANPGSQPPADTPAPGAVYSVSALPATTGSPAPYPVALPDAAEVDRQDASSVAQAAAVLMWSMNTATDTSQYAAELRASWLMTADYAAALQAHPPVGAPGAWFTTWAAHGAYTTVSAVRDLDDQPTDTPVSALRQYSVTATPHGAGGWTAAPLTATVFFQLTRAAASQPWAVSNLTISE